MNCKQKVRTFNLHTARGVGQTWGELVAAGMDCHFRTCAIELNYKKFFLFRKNKKISSFYNPPLKKKKWRLNCKYTISICLSCSSNFPLFTQVELFLLSYAIVVPDFQR